MCRAARRSGTGAGHAPTALGLCQTVDPVDTSANQTVGSGDQPRERHPAPVITVVEFLPGTTEDDAVKALHEMIIPGVKQAPGFVKGIWAGDDNAAHAVVVFDTEDQAKHGLQQVGDVVGGVQVTKSVVYRVHAEV